jgi:hypothetical protein
LLDRRHACLFLFMELMLRADFLTQNPVFRHSEFREVF